MRRLAIVLLLVAIAIATPAHARVGGGESYGGGGGSGGGGGDGVSVQVAFQLLRLLFWININYPAIGVPLDIVIVIIVIRWRKGQKAKQIVLLRVTPAPSSNFGLGQLSRFDPNFSEIVFTDFCYALYARVHHARGAGDLERYAPYLSAAARQSLLVRNIPGLREVRGVVVGAFRIVSSQLEGTMIVVTVEYESNITEIAQSESNWYLREQWTFERQRDVLSPPPEKAKAEHCPRCGAALKTRTDGSCEYCGVKVTSGAFNWYVRNITIAAKESRGPRLTSDVPEEGTELPTRMQAGFRQRFVPFQSQWPQLEQRVRDTATELQNAWSARDWERVRPLESETLFQTHRYWIDAYLRQGLRNTVDAYEISRVEPVRVMSDPFYDSITVRIWASGRDYTLDEQKKVVAGSPDRLRSWTEYWTFIRTRATDADPNKTVSCPNCGAAVVVGTSGICRFCGGKLTSGEFGWVLSRIEQDESYG